MLPISCNELNIGVGPRPMRRIDVDPIGPGLIGSLLLHALAALLVFFALPSLMQPPPEVLHVVPIDLVALGQVTASPARQQLARTVVTQDALRLRVPFDLAPHH